MASFCRSALMAGSGSIARSRALTQTSLNSLNPAGMASPFASATRTVPCATRFVSVLGFMESMMPLHSAIASTRLTSNIAVDSTWWSSLSLGYSSSVTRTPCSGHFKLSTKLACILVPPSFVLFLFPLLSGNCIVVFSTEPEHEPILTKQPCSGSTKLYCTALLLPCVPMAYTLLFVKRFP